MSAEEEAEMAAMLDLSKKKKKKKKKDKSSKPKSADGSPGGDAGASEAEMAEQRTLLAVDEEMQEGGPANEGGDPHDRKAEYTYSELLDRVVGILHAHNPDLIEKKRRNMKPPQLTRVGTKKTLWVNFQEICTMMQRPPEHVFQFFRPNWALRDLSTATSASSSVANTCRSTSSPSCASTS